MKVTFKNSAIVLSSLILAACGSSDNTSGHSEEHAHDMLISQQNTQTLSLLEEGVAEALAEDVVAIGATLLLSNTGQQAAVITAGAVQFVAAHHEEESGEQEHELPEVISITGLDSDVARVVNSKGHFSILTNGTTKHVPYASLLEGATPEAEPLTLPIVSQDYPALLIEESEAETVVLAFDSTEAVIYENGVASLELEHKKACVSVDSTAQTAEFALVSCDDSSFSVKLEEGESDHSIEFSDIAGISTAVDWMTRAGVFVGVGRDGIFYVVEEAIVQDEEVLLLENSFAATEAEVELCAWSIDSLSADIFALSSNALTVFDHEGNSNTIALDATEGASCTDLRLTTANNSVFVIDNKAQILYEIDKEANASEYHIHGRENVSVNDVASTIVFHELGTESAGHEH